MTPRAPRPGSTRTARKARADWRAALEGFIDRTDRVLALVEGFMPEAEWLDDGETLTYLHSCVSTRRQRVRVPETPMYLDAILVDEDLTGGLEPRLGRAHLRTLTIMGFPSQTWPGLLDDLNRLAFPYRWATRAVCLDKTDATKLLAKIRRQWFAKRKSIMAILKEVMTNEASVLMDSDAANKALDADAALQELGTDLVGEAYVTADRHGLGRGLRASPTSACAWSRRPFRAATSPACARASTPSRRGSDRFPATSTPMSASRRSRRSISRT